jgi:hypothetical protein
MNDAQVFAKLIAMNDEEVKVALARQVNDPVGRNDGGVVLGHYGIPTASHGGTAGSMAGMAAALSAEDSAFYRDPQLLAALERAADFMLRRQHEDGTISLGGTNFNSPPDTGFVINGMAQIYRLLSRQDWNPVSGAAGKVKLFLERTIPAMLTGGCHTPNHRWVIVAALGSLYELFDDPRLVARAEEWLAEGMDCTNDGEWTERSNGIYNTVSDIMLIYAARTLNRPELLEPVRRNLEMMVYMIHADGEVITDYSGRQDWGVRHDLSDYFLCYRIMAQMDRNPRFASMCDLVVANQSRLGPVNNHALLGWLLLPCEDIDSLERASLPTHYRKVFNRDYPIEQQLKLMEQAGHHGKIEHSSMHTAFGSPVMRLRDGITSATVMTRSSNFFALRHGDARLLGISLSTLFTPGVVQMEQFEETEMGCLMSTLMEKGYYGPVSADLLPPSARQEISPWYLLPHHQRPFTHVQQHRVQIEVVREQSEWLLRLRSDERMDVITQVALVFPADAKLTGSGIADNGYGILQWTGGELRLTAGDYALELIGGRSDHQFTQVGSSASRHAQTVLINLLTPFEHEIRIRLLGGTER